MLSSNSDKKALLTPLVFQSVVHTINTHKCTFASLFYSHFCILICNQQVAGSSPIAGLKKALLTGLSAKSFRFLELLTEKHQLSFEKKNKKFFKKVFTTSATWSIV